MNALIGSEAQTYKLAQNYVSQLRKSIRCSCLSCAFISWTLYVVFLSGTIDFTSIVILVLVLSSSWVVGNGAANRLTRVLCVRIEVMVSGEDLLLTTIHQDTIVVPLQHVSGVRVFRTKYDASISALELVSPNGKLRIAGLADSEQLLRKIHRDGTRAIIIEEASGISRFSQVLDLTSIFFIVFSISITLILAVCQTNGTRFPFYFQILGGLACALLAVNLAYTNIDRDRHVARLRPVLIALILIHTALFLILSFVWSS